MAKFGTRIVQVLLVYLLNNFGTTDIKADVLLQFFRPAAVRPSQNQRLFGGRNLFGHHRQLPKVLEPYVKVLLNGVNGKSTTERPLTHLYPKSARERHQSNDLLNVPTENIKPQSKFKFGVPSSNNEQTLPHSNLLEQTSFNGFEAARNTSSVKNNIDHFSNTAKTYGAILNAVLSHPSTPKPSVRMAFNSRLTTPNPGGRKNLRNSFGIFSSNHGSHSHAPPRTSGLPDMFRRLNSPTPIKSVNRLSNVGLRTTKKTTRANSEATSTTQSTSTNKPTTLLASTTTISTTPLSTSATHSTVSTTITPNETMTNVISTTTPEVSSTQTATFITTETYNTENTTIETTYSTTIASSINDSISSSTVSSDNNVTDSLNTTTISVSSSTSLEITSSSSIMDISTENVSTTNETTTMASSPSTDVMNVTDASSESTLNMTSSDDTVQSTTTMPDSNGTNTTTSPNEISTDEENVTNSNVTTSLPDVTTTSGNESEATTLYDSNNTTRNSTDDNSSTQSTTTGMACETESCGHFSDICMNGGTCIRECDESKCICPDGFYGFFCDKRTDAMVPPSE